MAPALAPVELQAGELAGRIDAARAGRRAEDLALFLAEGADHFEGRGSVEISRLRGYALAAFAETSLPKHALPYVLQELESAGEAYLIAGAARGLRGFQEPTARLAGFLVTGLRNVIGADDAISFATYAGSAPDTTAFGEICATLRWIAPVAGGALPELEAMLAECGGSFSSRARGDLRETIGQIRSTAHDVIARDCCPIAALLRPRLHRRAASGGRTEGIHELRMEDQDGGQFSFGEFSGDRPTLVTFFYTRCDNPRKCSLTISKLGQLQRLLGELGLGDRYRLAALTYDPAYDSAARLRAYGAARGLRFGSELKLLRAMEGDDALARFFQLRLTRAGPLVSRHQLEVYILDSGGRLHSSLQTLQWTPEAAAGALTAVRGSGGGASADRGRAGAISRTLAAGAVPALLMLMPKCPICWAAYLGALGLGSLQRVLSFPALVTLWLVSVLLQAAVLTRSAWINRNWLGLASWAAGVGLLSAGLINDLPVLSCVGALIAAAGFAWAGGLRPWARAT